MSDFQNAVTPARPDPFKRVRYSFGQLLGAADFEQEQGYAVEARRRHLRQLHGYGTVWGLKVEVRDGDAGPEVHVAPGVALTPAGREVCVPAAMCARLDDWLRASATVVREAFGAPPLTAALCVTLCYRECPTDVVPIPGEPCRSDEESMAPSRIAETFELRLCARTGSAPSGGGCGCPAPGAETEGRAAFARLLRRLRPNTRNTKFTSRDTLEDEVRRLGEPREGRPAGAEPALPVKPEEMRDLLGAAARVWTTEVLPRLLARDGMDGCAPPQDACVLLAELLVQVDATGAVGGGAAGVRLDETHRPVLLAGAVMQEWALYGGAAGV